LTFQIRPGGQTQDQSLEIQEAQKELAEEMDDVELISTSHIDHFTDNEHYGLGGYIECGKRAFNLVKKFFYNVSLTPDEVSPFFTRAAKGTSNTVLATLSPTNATYSVDFDFKSLVRLEGTGSYNVTGVEMKDMILEISYTKNGDEPSGLTILGKGGPANPSLYNANGIGVLSMKGLSIEASLPLFFNYFRLGGSVDKRELSWEISDNDRFETFEVQQSIDGRYWETLAIIPAMSGQTGQYSWIVTGIKFHTLYFRILAKQKTSNLFYSNILSVNTSIKPIDWKVYPNPIEVNSVIAYWSDENTQISWHLYSQEGKIISKNIFSLAKGLNTIPLKFPVSLNRGLYIVRIQTTQGISYRRVIH
jgi:hypothetical protein